MERIIRWTLSVNLLLLGINNATVLNSNQINALKLAHPYLNDSNAYPSLQSDSGIILADNRSFRRHMPRNLELAEPIKTLAEPVKTLSEPVKEDSPKLEKTPIVVADKPTTDVKLVADKIKDNKSDAVDTPKKDRVLDVSCFLIIRTQ